MANGWWNLDGTISNCVAAWQAIGAASYSASLVNLFNPGTSNLTTATGKDPSWSASTGWTGNKTDQFLDTNVNANKAHSVLIRYTAGTGSGHLLSSYYDGYGISVIWEFSTGYQAQWASSGYFEHEATGGVIAISSNNTTFDMFHNGTEIYSDKNLVTAPYAGSYYLFCRHVKAGAVTPFSDATIQAVAIYDGDIASYISDLTAAMAALSGPAALTAKDFDLSAVTFDAPGVNELVEANLTAKDFDLAAVTFDAPTLNLITDGLVAEYRFDDGSGTTVSEYVNNYDATLVSGTWTAEGIENGEISAASVPDSAFLGANGFTVMIVADVKSNSPVPVFAAKGGNDSTATPVKWRGYTSSPITFVVRANTANRTGGTEVSRKTAVMNKGWQVYSLIAPQAIESSVVQYINACKYLTPMQGGAGTGAATGTESPFASNIGAGKIAYILIYNRQLTHAEIEYNYEYLRATLAARSIALPSIGVGLAFNGDSLTSGSGASFDNDYPSQTMRLLGAGYDKWNFGIPGVGFNAFYSAGVDAAVSGSRSDYYYIMWGGSNNIDGGQSASATYTSLLADIAARKTAGYDKVIVLTAINRAQYSEDQRIQMLAYNALILDEDNQAAYDYTAIDIASDEQLWDYTNLEYFNADQVHLTDVGYGVVARFVSAAIMGHDMLSCTGMTLAPVTFDAPTLGVMLLREVWDGSVKLNMEVDFSYNELEEYK